MADSKVKDLVRQMEDNQQAIAKVNRKIEAAVGSQIAKKEELEKQNADMRQAIYEAMEANDLKEYDGDLLRIVRVLPSERTRFDSKRFEKERPKTYAKFLTTSKVKGSVRIKIKA